jgi:hypothetical protein
LFAKKKLSQTLSLTNFARSSFKTDRLNFFPHVLKVFTLLRCLCFCASIFSCFWVLLDRESIRVFPAVAK